MTTAHKNVRPAPDREMVDIADYVTGYEIKSALAYTTARYCLMDTIGCGLEALVLPGVHQADGPRRARRGDARRRARARHAV